MYRQSLKRRQCIPYLVVEDKVAIRRSPRQFNRRPLQFVRLVCFMHWQYCLVTVIIIVSLARIIISAQFQHRTMAINWCISISFCSADFWFSASDVGGRGSTASQRTSGEYTPVNAVGKVSVPWGRECRRETARP